MKKNRRTVERVLGIACQFGVVSIVLTCFINCAVAQSADAGKVFTTMTNGARMTFTDSGISYNGGLGLGMGTDTLYVRGQSAIDDSNSTNLLNLNQQSNDAPGSQNNNSGVYQSSSSQYHYWATPYYSGMRGFAHQSENSPTEGYYDGDEYYMSRTGVMTGVTKKYSNRTSMGLILGLSFPKISQSGSIVNDDSDSAYQTIDYGAEVTMTDFQFGLSFDHLFDNDWRVSSYIVGGTQSLDWKRSSNSVNVDSGEDVYREYISSTTGNTVGITVYLSKDYKMSENFTLTPMAGFESVHSWIFAAREEGDNSVLEDVFAGEGNTLRAVYDLYSLQKMVYHRNTIRAGAILTYDNGGNFGCNFKALYGVQVDEDLAPFATVAGDHRIFQGTVTGDGVGRSAYNLGTGLKLHLNNEKTSTLYGNYDVILYKYALTQTFSTTYAWCY